MKPIIYVFGIILIFSLSSCDKDVPPLNSTVNTGSTLKEKLIGKWKMVSEYDESSGKTTFYSDWYLSFFDNGDYIFSIYHTDVNEWEIFKTTFTILSDTSYKGSLTNEIFIIKIDEHNLETSQIINEVKYINTYIK